MSRSHNSADIIPSQDAEIVIQPATPAQRLRIARVLASAFITDEHTISLLPKRHRAKRLVKFFSIVIAEAMKNGGQVWVAKSANQDVIFGATIWKAPGASQGPLARIASLPGYLRVFEHRIFDAARTDRASALRHPSVAHWYLNYIGISPNARGKGVASLLLRDRIAAIDEQAAGAYLEASSPLNADRYERFGFASMGEIPAWGTTSSIGMWRAPRS